MKNKLILYTGEDIPFPEAQITIHQPRIGEISFIGEQNFLAGSRFLNFSLDMLKDVDKSDLEDKTDFEIFMSIMSSRERLSYKNDAISVLTLLFPEYMISCQPQGIILSKENFKTIIDIKNYDIFKDIVCSIFVLDEDKSQGKYNPADAAAERIAEKFKKREQILNDRKGKTSLDDITIIGHYMKVLSVGEGKDINSFNDYTFFQLKEEFVTFQNKIRYDMYIQAKMAGAKDIEDVNHWMDNNSSDEN